MLGVLLLFFGWFHVEVTSFSTSLRTRRSRDLQLFSSEPNDGIDSLRSMLEVAWNSDTMGQVPSDAKIAANEAFSSILSASDKGISIFFIDLLLPAFDITQGSNLYDEVLCVEYCIGLAECFKDKSRILVRDQKTVDIVQRILDRREKERLEAEPIQSDYEHNGGELATDDSDDINETDILDDTTVDDSISSTVGVDAFRQQLMSSWKSMDDREKSPPEVNKASSPDAPLPKSKTRDTMEKRYQLASMFGDSKISQGADMMQEVVNALYRHAMPDEDQKNLIILSAIAMDEMVAVRSLASKYSGQKNIILVNCKLDPIPRELYGAETVYSMLPLIARAKDAEQVVPRGETIPKAVVLRRYPGDWQVFVDMGNGFILANTAPSDLSNKRGPPMKWIQQSVQDFIRIYS